MRIFSDSDRMRGYIAGVRKWLASLSFRTGMAVAVVCVACYFISFAQMLLSISVATKGGYGPHLQSRKGLAVHRHNSSSAKQDCSEYAPCSAVARSLPKRVSDRAHLWSVTSVTHTVAVFERRHSGLFLEDAAQI